MRNQMLQVGKRSERERVTPIYPFSVRYGQAGFSKCGTTDLFSKIVKHPDVLNNTGELNGKETLWWSWKRYGYGYYWFNNKPMESLLQYFAYFENATSIIQRRVDATGFHHSVTGDGTPLDFWDFTGWPQIHQNVGLKKPKVLTPHLIRHISPGTKFILVFRDPVERLYSGYFYWHFTELSREEFHKQVKQSITLLKDCQIIKGLKLCLFDRLVHCNITVRVHLGIYWVFLEEWLNVFPRAQFLILRSEDRVKNPKSTIKAIFDFLELRDVSDVVLDRIVVEKPVYVTETKLKSKPMFDKTKKLLQEFYKPHNEKLSRLLKDERFKWGY